MDEGAAEIIERMPDAFMTVDRGWRFTYVNRAAERITYLRREGMLGRTVWELFPARTPRFEGALRRAMDEGVADWLEEQDLSPDTWFEVSVYPSAHGIVIHARDFTERQRAKDNTYTQEETLQKVFDHFPALISFYDEHGRLKLVNREWERTMGWTLEEIRESGLDIFAEAYPDSQYRQQVREFIAAADGKWRDFQVRVRDGRVIAMTWIRIRLTDGTSIGFGQDITRHKRSEEALRLFRSLLDQSSDAIEVIDPDTLRFLDCNESAYQSLGYSRAEFLSLSVWDIDPTINPPRLAWIEEEIGKSGSVTFESLHRRKDGSMFPVEVNVKLVRLERDYRLAVVRDITERKRAEEALRRAEEKYHSIFENAVEGIFQTTPDGHFITANPALARMLGYSSPEELLRDRTDIARQHYVEPERRSEFKRQLAKHGIVRDFEHQAYRKDGSKIWLSESVRAVRDESGSVLYYEGFTEDVTERKQAVDALRRSESKLAEAQRIARIGSWDWDIQSSTVTWSDELYRVFGVDPQTFNPAREDMIMGAIHAEDHALVASAIESSLRSKEPFNFYYRILRPDGEERVIHSRGEMVSDVHGNPIRVFGTAQDVTERKQSEERLRATTEQLRALSARFQSAKEEEGARIAREIHDELGATLSSLRWDLEEVDEVISETTELSQLAALRKKIESMIRLTDTTVNTVRRIASELRPDVLDEFGLVEAIRWHAQQFQARTGIVCRCDGPLENIGLNREQSTAVFRIFQEAMTNILRHAQATRVDIMMKQEADEFVLLISDNGKGIKEQVGSQSFGLLGMRERAHLIGGDIDISGAEGKGTVISVRVPTPAKQ